ncbi:MAG TPA: hypothetical protein PLX15_00595 [Candidatus Woesearchaeota archaeon]|nr:hypothetical protein [Candidatus Woesearchaeota archaeon]
MKESTVNTLLRKGWSEEEINDYFTRLYRKEDRLQNKRLSRIVFFGNVVMILFLALMMGVLTLVFTGFQWSVLSLGVIIFFSSFITYRNKGIISELFFKKRVFLLNASISFFLAVIALLFSYFFYDLFLASIDGGPGYFPLIEYCIVSFAVVLTTWLFLIMFEEK